MADVERARTALHEAGHHVVAALYGWDLGPVTIEAGHAALGCSRARPPLVPVPADADYSEPFIRWPGMVRRRIEGEALFYAAGDVAELLFAPRTGRVPASAAVTAAGQLAVEPAAAGEPGREQPELPPATDQERADVAAVCDDPAAVYDDERLAGLARWTHGNDPAAGGAWLAYVETQARALLLVNELRVRRLADVLLTSGTVGAAAARRILA